MKKVIICLYTLLVSALIYAQTSNDTLGKNTAFFMEIKKVKCDTGKGFCNEQNSPYIECYTNDLLSLTAFATGEKIKVLTNDSLKARQCVTIKSSNKSFPYFWGFEWQGGVKILEHTFNCKITDTVVNLDVWVIKTGVKSSSPLIHDAELNPITYTGKVFMPDKESDITNYLITKNGTLEQLLDEIGYATNHIVVAENTNILQNRYTFEMPAFPIWEADFDSIYKELNQAIGFEMYKAVKPIKCTYPKFL